MLSVRRSEERGHFDHGWLDTRHTFSFADYRDPRFMGFRSLRVINEDRVQPGKGFPTHGHQDMEIISYVLEGAIAHKDSTGTGAILKPGEVQRMSAGTGVTHSEFNPSPQEVLHFLQIRILPAKRGLKPEYEQKAFSESERRGKLRMVVSPDGREGSLIIHQDAFVFASNLPKGLTVTRELGRGRSAWIQVARGEVSVNGERLRAGDGASLSEEKRVEVFAEADAELLLFDLA